MAIETKDPTRHSPRVEAALVADLRRFGLLDGDEPVTWNGRPAVRVMSFSAAALRRVQGLAPHLPTVRLLSRMPAQAHAGRLPVRVSAIGPSLPLLRWHPWLVDQAHSTGLAVHAWTVNHEPDMAYDVEAADVEGQRGGVAVVDVDVADAGAGRARQSGSRAGG